jgi:hypothetical protein
MTSNVAGMRPSLRIRSNAASIRRQRAAPVRPRGRRARRVRRAERLQFGQQRPGIHIGQRQRLHFHHRICEACPDEHVAEIVHVDEAVGVRMAVGTRERRAQFLQRVRPERRE